MTNNDLLYHLYRGEFDDVIDQIIAAAKQRLRLATIDRLNIMKKGDTVVFNATVNPKSWVGSTAEVIRVGKDVVRVRLDYDCDCDFTSGTTVEVPASTLQFA